MELPLSTLALVILGFSFSFYALLVETQNDVNIPNQPIPPSPGLQTPSPRPPPLLPSSKLPPFSPPPPLPSGTPSEQAPSPHSPPQPRPEMPSNQSPSPHFPPQPLPGMPSNQPPSPNSPPQPLPGTPSNQPPSAQSPLRPLPGTPSKQQPGNHQSPHHLKKNETMPSQPKNKHDNQHESQNRIQHGGKPPPPAHKINAGKKIGLLFAGIAGILQIGVVGFLVFKRQQLLKVKDRYESCS